MLRRLRETSAAQVPKGSVCFTLLLTHGLYEAWDQSGFHVSARSSLAMSLGAVDKHFVKPFECVLHSFMRWLVRCGHKREQGSGKQSLLYSQLLKRGTTCHEGVM